VRLKLTIEYDGTPFRGWAAQPGLPTVESTLADALARTFSTVERLAVAGRTDSGVHALGQVASFVTGAELPTGLAHRLNGTVPADIAVTAADRVADGFDARRNATSRTYLYRLLTRAATDPFERGRALWWPHRCDREALAACAAALPGSHDFTAFTPTQTDHVRFDREIAAAGWTWEEPIGAFRITADAFMRNMVRVLVGTMLEVANGRRTVEDFTRLLEGAPRSAAGETAPAHGLYLESVSYD
jgi:tRNA pseudouridine38-40 synthase